MVNERFDSIDWTPGDDIWERVSGPWLLKGGNSLDIYDSALDTRKRALDTRNQLRRIGRGETFFVKEPRRNGWSPWSPSWLELAGFPGARAPEWIYGGYSGFVKAEEMDYALRYRVYRYRYSRGMFRKANFKVKYNGIFMVGEQTLPMWLPQGTFVLLNTNKRPNRMTLKTQGWRPGTGTSSNIYTIEFDFSKIDDPEKQYEDWEKRLQPLQLQEKSAPAA